VSVGDMKKFLALICLILWAPLCHADKCTDRIVRMANLIFPASLNAVHIIDKEKRCWIDVVYSINGDGRSENIVSMAEKEICSAFKVTAMRAIRSSIFQPGEYLYRCYTRVNLELEDGQLKWEFGEVPAYLKP
jgi:hypothetical protein